MATNLIQVVTGVLSAAVANNGTFTVAYPQDPSTLQTLNAGFFTGAVNHKFALNQNTVLSAPNQFSLTFGASNITVTNKSGSTWPINSTFGLQLELVGDLPLNDPAFGTTLNYVTRGFVAIASIGSPATASATAVINAAAQTALVNGLSTPFYTNTGGGRAFTAKSSNVGDTTQTVTLKGVDIYGVSMVETIALNGTTGVNGKKAFARLDSVIVSATMAGNLSIGTIDVFGLPFFLPSSGYIIRELQDGTTPTAGTFVAGMTTSGGSTATTADVRGTWTPNAASDGSKSFQVIALLPDAGYLGAPQYTA